MKPLLTIAGLLALAATAAGQPDATTLPDVVVTARKRSEPGLDVPQSMTVIPASALRDAGAGNIREATLLVPNASLVEFAARRLSFPFVRGIGSGQGDPAVATYVDGVPLLSGSATNLPLLNVERIEFLRGPQGTLYGRNALGGLIHVVTRQPGDRLELRAESTAGSHGLGEGKLVLGAPLAEDKLSLGLAGLLLRRDGFTVNDFTGHDVDDRDTLFGQGQLVLTPDARNRFRLGLLAERTRDGGFALSDLAALRDRPHRISQDFEGVTRRDVLLPSLTWTREGDAVDLASVTAYQGTDVLETADFDFTALDGVRRRTVEESRSFLQEFRLSSAAGAPVDLGGDVALRWLVGILAFTSDSDRGAANEFRPGGVGVIAPVAGIDEGDGEFRDRGLGVFGQATATLPGGLELGAGLRFDHERKDARLHRRFTSGGVPLSSGSESHGKSFDEILPRFDVGYRLGDDARLYAFAARGFKAGGFNLAAPAGRVPYSPETSWTFEAGTKTSLLGGRVRLDAAVFWIEWEEMQLSQFDVEVGGYVTNAGRATSRGLEVEAAVRPAGGLDVFASLGVTDAAFDSGTDQFGQDVGGNRLPFAPRTTVAFGAQWVRDLGAGVRLHVRGEYAHVGTFHYDAGNRGSERFGIANFRVGVGGDAWRLEAFLRNAFDAEYVPVAFQPNPADPSFFVGESGPPRTFGITLSLDF